MDATNTTPLRYRIDATQSRFIVQAEASGLLSMMGHNPTIAVRAFGGDARFSPASIEQSSLLIIVKADSLAVVGDIGEKDRLEIERRMREEVLETSRYPEIVFMSTGVQVRESAGNQHHLRISGQLQLHGVTRNCTIDARVITNGQGLRAQGAFPLRQTDYNIKPVSALGGTLKVKDELKLSFDINAVAKE